MRSTFNPTIRVVFCRPPNIPPKLERTNLALGFQAGILAVASYYYWLADEASYEIAATDSEILWRGEQSIQ